MLRNAARLFLERLNLLVKLCSNGDKRSYGTYQPYRVSLRSEAEQCNVDGLANKCRAVGNAYLFGDADSGMASDRVLRNSVLSQPERGPS
jgi:hypothetical protein